MQLLATKVDGIHSSSDYAISCHFLGWLFLGSHTGDSQILAAPRRLLEELTAGMPISDAALLWQVHAPAFPQAMCMQYPPVCAAHENVDPHSKEELA